MTLPRERGEGEEGQGAIGGESVWGAVISAARCSAYSHASNVLDSPAMKGSRPAPTYMSNSLSPVMPGRNSSARQPSTTSRHASMALEGVALTKSRLLSLRMGLVGCLCSVEEEPFQPCVGA